jgi:hypothetical protein
VHALYGLCTSGARWHDIFDDVMHLMSVSPSKADPDVWMHYCISYVLVYVDNNMIICKAPLQFFDSLINEHGFKMKGVGTPKYHVGGDFYHDFNGTLVWGSHLYVLKTLNNYETMFGSIPKESATPMIGKDHPSIDTSDLLDALGIKHYQ